jgi:hypothetical protein
MVKSRTRLDALSVTPSHRRSAWLTITVGGDLDAVTGKRVTFAFFPWNWNRADGCIIRLVAITDPAQASAAASACWARWKMPTL